MTNEINKEYTFNIFNNNEASSSIYEPNQLNWAWNNVKVNKQIKLISNTIENILQEYNWTNIKYDVVLDVQGAELEVLKGFGKNNLNNIEELKVEISKKEFYKGGVLFNDLHNYLLNCGFQLIEEPKLSHCDATYKKIR